MRLIRGQARVTKKDLERKYGHGKNVIVEQTRRHPMALERYRADKRRAVRPPMGHIDLAASEGTPPPDWDALLAAVLAVPTGRDTATAYENAVEALLTALFYPSLANPRVQDEIHDGRKRIDITYANVATDGFFGWLSQHYPSSQIFSECKNYASDPANPALDQLIGRFSPRRGLVGILVCRTLADKELFIQRCRDSADDDQGFVLPLDDDDLRALVEERRRGQGVGFGLLDERFRQLIN